MTGIVLCEISSGLAIEPNRMPDGVVGDDTPVTFITIGAVGGVTFGFTPPGGPTLTGDPIPPGRTLTDNEDGTATVTGTFERAGVGPAWIYAWDEAGQIATIYKDCTVRWAIDPYVNVKLLTNAASQIDLIGGPSLSTTVTHTFDPPLPEEWDVVEENNGHRVTVTPTTGGEWHGEVSFLVLEGWPHAAYRYITLDLTIPQAIP